MTVLLPNLLSGKGRRHIQGKKSVIMEQFTFLCAGCKQQAYLSRYIPRWLHSNTSPKVSAEGFTYLEINVDSCFQVATFFFF